jgi:hypothetical protein
VVIDNVNLRRSCIRPTKDDAPLVVDPDTVKSRQVALQRFQPVAGRRPQIFELMSVVEHVQLPLDDPGDSGPSGPLRSNANDEECLYFVGGEALNGHPSLVYLWQVYLVQVIVDGLLLPLLVSLPVLVYMKLKAGRQKDTADLVELLKRGRVDLEEMDRYLEEYAPEQLRRWQKVKEIAAREE